MVEITFIGATHVVGSCMNLFKIPDSAVRKGNFLNLAIWRFLIAASFIAKLFFNGNCVISTFNR